MGAGDESICKKWKQFTGNLKNPHILILNLCPQMVALLEALMGAVYLAEVCLGGIWCLA